MSKAKSVLFFSMSLLFFIASSSSCRSQKEKQKTTGVVSLKKIENTDNLTKPNSYKILESSIENNILKVLVSYSGGCKDQTFDLVWNGGYLKSMPPQVNLLLVHNTNNDSCRELIEKELKFDISSAKYPSENKEQSTLQLNLGKQKLNYTY